VKRITSAICFFLLLTSVENSNADLVQPPREAKTRDELVKQFGTTIGFGHVEKWEFTTAGRQLIAFWYCPYSGRAACYVHAYYYAAAIQRWVLFIDRLLEPATGLSAEISSDHSLVFKNRDGKVAVKESLDALPR
jgi:hypothetical protein